MSAPKFTPGPWEIGEPESHDSIATILKRGEQDEIVAEVCWMEPFPKDQARADARLIAAAPAMYAALVPFAEQDVAETSICHLGLVPMAECARCKPILAARDAITKAVES